MLGQKACTTITNVFYCFVFGAFLRQVSCSPGWTQTHYTAKEDHKPSKYPSYSELANKYGCPKTNNSPPYLYDFSNKECFSKQLDEVAWSVTMLVYLACMKPKFTLQNHTDQTWWFTPVITTLKHKQEAEHKSKAPQGGQGHPGRSELLLPLLLFWSVQVQFPAAPKSYGSHMP